MVRLRRAYGRLPFVRTYEIELTPPDASALWRPRGPVTRVTLTRKLLAEGYYQRDVADLLLEADELWDAGQRNSWIEHDGIRPVGDS